MTQIKKKKKLDAQLRVQWELLVDTIDDPSVEEFVTFLTKFCKAASAGQSRYWREKPLANKSQPKLTTLHAHHNQRPPTKENLRQFSYQVCKVKPGHLLIACFVFKEMTPEERHRKIKEPNRCFLCFSERVVVQCKHQKLCSECGGRHHSLLHLDTAGKTKTNLLSSSNN